MRTLSRSIIGAILICLALASAAGQRKDHLPRLPGAALLLGYPPTDLAVATADKALKVEGGGDWYVSPSMSADGRVIASARTVASDPPAPRPRLIVGTYSMKDSRWTDYKGLEVFDGDVAISADGSKVACVTRSIAGAPSHIRILDVRTGNVTVAPDSADNAGPALTWSPDGRRIAFVRDDKRSRNGVLVSSLRSVYILNIESGTVSKIAEGAGPSWSPSGEWIAFFDYSPHRDDPKGRWYATNANRVSLMRPDGTGSRVLFTFNQDEDLRLHPVWSPDSKTILINRFRDDSVNPRQDIYMLDLAALKLTKKFKNTVPVYGWASAK